MTISKIENQRLEPQNRFYVESSRDLRTSATHRVMKSQYAPFTASFLVLMCAEGFVLSFVAGCAWLGGLPHQLFIRKKKGEELPPHNFSLRFTPDMILPFMQDQKWPDYRRDKVYMSRKEHIDEIPFVTAVLGNPMSGVPEEMQLHIPEAVKWGRVDFFPQQSSVNESNRGTNIVQVLNDVSWNTVPQSEKWTCGSMSSLLHPMATEYADRIPSAWSLAASTAKHLGGMHDDPAYDLRIHREEQPVLIQALLDDKKIRDMSKPPRRGGGVGRRRENYRNPAYDQYMADPQMSVMETPIEGAFQAADQEH